MKKRLLVASLAISMLAVVAAPASAGNWWGGYEWDKTTIAVEYNVDGSWDGLLDDVLIDWNKSVLTLNKTGPDGSSSCKNPLGAVGTTGLIEACNGTYGQNGWLGIARIWLNGTEITSAVAAVNDSYFNTAPYNDPIAKRHVLCQEIGHTISLDHQNSPRKRSCMNDRWGLLDDRFQSPNGHDYDQLAEIYGISGGDSGGGGGGPCKSPGHPSCKSGLTTFEIEDLGNGRAVLTWITWVPGQGPTG
jgi:hypothetical protein